MKITDLQPQAVFRFFDEITRVPRPSKKETQILEYLKKFAADRNLTCLQDATGNIVIRKGATPGMQDCATIILQSHVDMVCEKNSDKVHNFDTDPITTIVDGEWLKADGTTLGADDGIGVAAELAILDANDIPHGPIECLFTIDEETGLTGAMGLDKKLIDGKILLNLDSEDEGEMFIGCAGGMGTIGTFQYTPEAANKNLFYASVKVFGLKGGHSGGDIHVGLGNANKLLARTLYNIQKEMPLSLASFIGGNLDNAIPREAEALIGVPADMKEQMVAIINHTAAEIADELKHVDSGVKLTVSSCEAPQYVIDADTAQRLLNCLFIMPHGVLGMSHDIEGLVESSTNLASVKMPEQGIIKVETSQRSSVASQKFYIGDLIAQTFALCKANVEVHDGYPGWAPNTDSEILKVVVNTYRSLFGKEPAVKAIHAGLECGLFFEKFPYLDMVSFGPTLRDVHSPDERLEIKTVDMFWRHLLAILKEAPKAK